MTDPRSPTTPGVDASRSSTSGIVAFLALTFAVTWACFIPAAVLSARVSIADPGSGLGALILLGTIAPSLVALALTARAEGAAGVGALLGRILQWRVSARYYLFAVSYMAVVKLTAAVAHRLITDSWPRFWEEAWYVMAAAIVVSTWVQAGEEIGWRGYALPRLAALWGLPTASIVLGVIWAVWHGPLFYLHGADTYGQPFVAYLLQVVAISVAMAWLWWRTHGSLLLVMLMHASINNTKGIVATIPRLPADPLRPEATLTAWLAVAALWAVAVPLLVHMVRANDKRPVGETDQRGISRASIGIE